MTKLNGTWKQSYVLKTDFFFVEALSPLKIINPLYIEVKHDYSLQNFSQESSTPSPSISSKISSIGLFLD